MGFLFFIILFCLSIVTCVVLMHRDSPRWHRTGIIFPHARNRQPALPGFPLETTVDYKGRWACVTHVLDRDTPVIEASRR
jgi:hypothetical protein